MRAGFVSILILRLTAVVLLAFATVPVFAQDDPPGRVGRINYSEGAVSFAPAGDDEFTDADLNRPLSPGDKLWTDKGVRADLQVGSAAVRMEGRTRLTVLALTDQSTQLSITQGTVFVRVRTLPEGENFEIDTPNLAWRASYPGDYRIDVDGQRGTTRVTIHSGTGAVYGEKGEALPMGGGQQIIFKGRTLAQVDSHEQPPQDNFDRWAAERNRREDQSPAARYVPREVVGYQLLDSTGQWQQDANYGVVWFPQNAKGNWAPYRNGRWEWVAPWGWTWIDEAPWAFVTSHYGRWAVIDKKWAWVPGRMGLRPIYAPALVAFAGNANAPLSVGGKQVVAWFPLAPGEAWQPTYNASQLYTSNVNANMPPVQQGGEYAYMRKPEAVTAIAAEDFQRGKASKGSLLRVAAGALGNAQVVAAPSMPEHAKTMVARSPAPKPDIKQALNKGPTAAQQLEMQRQADAAKQLEAQKQAEEARKIADAKKQAEAQKLAEAQAQRERERLAREEQAQRQQREQLAKAEQSRAEQARAEQARRDEQARLAEQQKQLAGKERLAQKQERIADKRERAAEKQERVATQAKLAKQQRAAQEARVAQEQRAAEQARRAEVARREREQREQREAVAKRAEQARRDQVAKREQAKREQVAALLREREAKRELQARRAQEAKRLAAAKRDEEARRIAHAQEVERSRRAAEQEAQVLQAQRAQREEVRRVSEEKEKQRAQQEAWARQQQLLAEQWKRDQQAFEEQRRQKAQLRQRPDLRRSQPAAEPEVWQRGIPILNPGRTS